MMTNCNDGSSGRTASNVVDDQLTSDSVINTNWSLVVDNCLSCLFGLLK